MKRIEPIKKDNTVVIVFESTDYFVPYLDICIKSLCDHFSSAFFYDVIILEDNIEGYNKEYLRRNIEGLDNVSLRFFDPTEVIEGYYSNAKKKYLKVNYFRLALPWILEQYDMAFNLGADIIVKSDLGFFADFTFKKGACLAGAKDLGWTGRLRYDIPAEELELEFPQEYVNADVLVYNLKQIREQYKMDDLLLPWQEHLFRCNEQDVLNLVFDGKKQILDLRWNTYPDRMLSTEDILRNSDLDIGLWKAALEDPFIIHFAAVPKPWDEPMIGYGDEWWNYARKSVYYEVVLNRRLQTSVFHKKKLHDYIFLVGDKIFPKGSKGRAVIHNYKIKRISEHYGIHSK